MKGTYITVYVTADVKRKLDALCKALGVGRGKAIGKLLEASEKKGGGK